MAKPGKFIINRLLFVGNVFALLYFIGLYFVYHYQVDYVLIGVFVELLTIPFLLLLPFSLIYSIVEFFRKKHGILLLGIFIFSIVTILFNIIVTIYTES